MMQSHRFLLISIITFIFINLPKSFSSTNNEQYTSCRNPFQCGTITATYPFWGNNRPSYCGQPGFQLNCTEGINTTSIQISSEIFHVLSIDNDTQFLKIARTDFFHGICPQKSLNTSLNFTLFDYTSSDQNLTLFYGCSNLTIAAPPVPNFTCSINGVISDVHVIGFGPIPVIDGLGKCNVSVLVPVLLSSFDALRSNESSLGEVLNQGFEVQWFMNKTFSRDCIESGGHCGYNWTSNEPICFCKDEAYLTICPASGNKSNLGRILAIGFSVGAVIILITCFLFFIYRRCIKKKYPSSTLRSRNISCNGTLKIDREKESKLFGAHIFTYTELEEATNNFDSSKELGDGGFGTVYHGKLKDGCEVAVKRLFEHNYKRVEQFMNEVEILTRLRHHNLVTLYGCTSHESRELLLVYEFIPNGTVADHLHGACRKAGLLKWPVRMNIAIESASAIAYLHATDIIHRDVKTTNILLDEKFSVKVADFGLSRLFPTDVTHVSTAPQGTPGYVDPEYYECYQLTDKSDVYSFGVVLIELISSKKAVDTNRNRHEINLASLANNKIRNRRLQELVDPCLGFETDFAVRKKIILVAELAFRCLQQEREIRPSMGEVLEVLRQINSEEYKVEKAEELDIREDDMGSHDDDVLPLSLITLSMNSVTDKWVSLPSTPNTSGSIILTSR